MSVGQLSNEQSQNVKNSRQVARRRVDAQLWNAITQPSKADLRRMMAEAAANTAAMKTDNLNGS